MMPCGDWNRVHAGAAQRAPPAPPLSIIAYGVAVFIIGATAFTRVYYLNYAVQAFGAFLAFVYLLYTLQARAYLSMEVFFYAAFVAWGVTGAFAALSPELFRSRLITVFQIWVLMVIVCGQTSGRRELSFSLLALLVGVAIVGAASILSGSYREAEEGARRLTGLGQDVNYFGVLMIFATIVLMYFWVIPGRLGRVKYLLLGVPMVLATMACILSGSRGSVAGMGVLYLLWIWFCFRKTMLRQGRVLLAVMLVLAIGGYAFVSYAARAGVGQRFERTWESVRGGRVEGSTRTRLEMYRIGLDLILRSPLVGVGLGNFILHTPGYKVAHSDWTEVSATTGLPGAVAYFAIYAVLWVRAGRIRRDGSDPVAASVAGLTRAVVLTVLFLGLGGPYYASKEGWILLGSLIGYTNVVWQGLRSRAAAGPVSGVMAGRRSLPPARLPAGGGCST
jgi:O-antigen ligase